MKNLKFSRLASSDIDEIYLYGFINFGEQSADLYLYKMKDTLKIICENPNIGRLDTRLNPAIHRFDFDQHVIFYDVTPTEILIVRILYKNMDFVRHFS